MCRAEGASIMQNSQLGQIEALKDRVCNLEGKLEAQDVLISNLVSNNLDHLQANMTLTQHINRLEVKWSNDQAQFWNIKSVLHDLCSIMGAEMDSNLLGPSTLGSGGDREEDQGRDAGSGVSGAGTLVSATRPLNPTP